MTTGTGQLSDALVPLSVGAVLWLKDFLGKRLAGDALAKQQPQPHACTRAGAKEQTHVDNIAVAGGIEGSTGADILCLG